MIKKPNNIKGKNLKLTTLGFTLVELLVSLVLITILSLALFKTVVNIQEKQMQNIAINKFKAFEVTLNSEIEQDFLKDKITEITECGKNCYNIEYKNRGTVKISIDTDNNTITYGTLKEKIPDDYKLYGELSMTKYESDIEGVNSFVYLDIPINSSLEPSKDGLKYMYVYDKNESNIVADLPEPKQKNAVEKIIPKVGTCGLYQDEHGDYRYAGNNNSVCNYVTFNNETWRIIGIFDTENEVGGAKEKRIKLVRNDVINGDYQLDSSLQSINDGWGINQWGKSTYVNGEEYEGADLMRELNGDYLNTNLTSNPYWYNSKNNTQTQAFDKSQVLSAGSQKLIDDALWYLGAFENNTHTAKEAYQEERGTNTGKVCSGGTWCTDTVVRTTKWVGKVGLPYPSDYGYASSACYNDNTKYIEYSATNGYNIDECKNSNWLASDSGYWLITPNLESTHANFYWNYYPDGRLCNDYGVYNIRVRPTVYLKSNVEIVEGDGTESNPYKFTIKEVPDGYQQIDYIESTGTQYIDTGFVGANGIIAKFTTYYTSEPVTGSTGAIIGSHNTTGSVYGRNQGYYFGNGKWELGYGDYADQVTAESPVNKKVDVEFSTIIGDAYLNLNNNRLITKTNGTTLSSNNVCIFRATSINQSTNARLYSAKIYDSTKKLVRDFVPCYRKSDGEIGLYDRVENKFYTNAGTGVFLKGNDV